MLGWVVDRATREWEEESFEQASPPVPLNGPDDATKLSLPLPPSPGEFPPLQYLLKSYKTWESSKFPFDDVRVRVSTGMVKLV